MEQRIYLDNAATTKLSEEAFEEMKPFFFEEYANPSGIYRFAQTAKNATELAREKLAAAIGARPEEIYFTGGGSEADNWAIKGAAFAYEKKGKHIITTKIEHHAVLHTCAYLEQCGFEVTYLDVDGNGSICLEELEKAIRPDTILISAMTANNEIGTIEPISQIGALAKRKGVLFHTDAVQAFGHIPLDVEEMQIDLLSASAHKIHGPKGTGFLYIRKQAKLGSFLHGGAQERGKRAGTLNVPGIVGFARAAELALADMEKVQKQEEELRDYAIARIEKEIPYAILNGERKRRLPNNINFCFRFIEGESMLILLDEKGICASSGSACTSGSLDPSHVMLAIGRPHEIAHGSLRLTLSKDTTKEELDITIEELKRIISQLRNMSPLYEDFLKEEQNVQ